MDHPAPPPLPGEKADQPVEHQKGFLRRMVDERREKKADQEAAEAEYLALLQRLGAEGPALVPALREAAEAADLSQKRTQELSSSTFRDYAEKVLADNLLSEQEEKELLNVAQALGFEEDTIPTTYGDILNELVVARVNDGRLPTLDQPHLMVKAGESVHIETDAALMKEVTLRQYQGGYSGVSFRIAKGVRFNTGGVRGKSVVVGTELQVADTGVLSISSQRAVFLGQKSTIEMPYKKLLNMSVFSDGIRFHISSRKTAPLFKVDSGNVVAAVVNAAVQRLS